MPNDDQEPQKSGLYMITPDEMRLLRRLRQLHTGVHLVIISTDGSGLRSLTVIGSGKAERLQKPSDAE